MILNNKEYRFPYAQMRNYSGEVFMDLILEDLNGEQKRVHAAKLTEFQLDELEEYCTEQVACKILHDEKDLKLWSTNTCGKDSLVSFAEEAALRGIRMAADLRAARLA